LKNEVKKKMMMTLRKSRYQSHNARSFRADVNNFFAMSYDSHAQNLATHVPMLITITIHNGMIAILIWMLSSCSCHTA